MKTLLFAAALSCMSLTCAEGAHASSIYDGPWNLNFVTQHGPCDPTY